MSHEAHFSLRATEPARMRLNPSEAKASDSDPISLTLPMRNSSGQALAQG